MEIKKIKLPASYSIALSGGGLRSAAFSFGVLSFLKQRDLLPATVPFLSTVSGGGYLGGALVRAVQDGADTLPEALGSVSKFLPALPGRRHGNSPTEWGAWIRSGCATVPDIFSFFMNFFMLLIGGNLTRFLLTMAPVALVLRDCVALEDEVSADSLPWAWPSTWPLVLTSWWSGDEPASATVVAAVTVVTEFSSAFLFVLSASGRSSSFDLAGWVVAVAGSFAVAALIPSIPAVFTMLAVLAGVLVSRWLSLTRIERNSLSSIETTPQWHSIITISSLLLQVWLYVVAFAPDATYPAMEEHSNQRGLTSCWYATQLGLVATITLLAYMTYHKIDDDAMFVRCGRTNIDIMYKRWIPRTLLDSLAPTAMRIAFATFTLTLEEGSVPLGILAQRGCALSLAGFLLLLPLHEYATPSSLQGLIKRSILFFGPLLLCFCPIVVTHVLLTYGSNISPADLVNLAFAFASLIIPLRLANIAMDGILSFLSAFAMTLGASQIWLLVLADKVDTESLKNVLIFPTAKGSTGLSWSVWAIAFTVVSAWHEFGASEWFHNVYRGWISRAFHLGSGDSGASRASLFNVVARFVGHNRFRFMTSATFTVLVWITFEYLDLQWVTADVLIALGVAIVLSNPQLGKPEADTDKKEEKEPVVTWLANTTVNRINNKFVTDPLGAIFSIVETIWTGQNVKRTRPVEMGSAVTGYPPETHEAPAVSHRVALSGAAIATTMGEAVDTSSLQAFFAMFSVSLGRFVDVAGGAGARVLTGNFFMSSLHIFLMLLGVYLVEGREEGGVVVGLLSSGWGHAFICYSLGVRIAQVSYGCDPYSTQFISTSAFKFVENLQLSWQVPRMAVPPALVSLSDGGFTENTAVAPILMRLHGQGESSTSRHHILAIDGIEWHDLIDSDWRALGVHLNEADEGVFSKSVRWCQDKLLGETRPIDVDLTIARISWKPVPSIGDAHEFSDHRAPQMASFFHTMNSLLFILLSSYISLFTQLAMQCSSPLEECVSPSVYTLIVFCVWLITDPRLWVFGPVFVPLALSCFSMVDTPMHRLFVLTWIAPALTVLYYYMILRKDIQSLFPQEFPIGTTVHNEFYLLSRAYIGQSRIAVLMIFIAHSLLIVTAVTVYHPHSILSHVVLSILSCSVIVGCVRAGAFLSAISYCLVGAVSVWALQVGGPVAAFTTIAIVLSTAVIAGLGYFSFSSLSKFPNVPTMMQLYSEELFVAVAAEGVRSAAAHVH
jgi:hypothetical protein